MHRQILKEKYQKRKGNKIQNKINKRRGKKAKSKGQARVRGGGKQGVTGALHKHAIRSISETDRLVAKSSTPKGVGGRRGR